MLYGLQANRFYFAVNLFDKPLKHIAGAQFGKAARSIGKHIHHDLGPSYR